MGCMRRPAEEKKNVAAGWLACGADCGAVVGPGWAGARKEEHGGWMGGTQSGPLGPAVGPQSLTQNW